MGQDPLVLPAARLDEKGRCCGRKPLIYKRPPFYFCTRCDRAYDLDEGEQIENWAWKRDKQGDYVSQTNRRSTPTKKPRRGDAGADIAQEPPSPQRDEPGAYHGGGVAQVRHWTAHCDESPLAAGWYAIGKCWELEEGLIADAARWDGEKWERDENSAICRWAGPFEDERAASDWADSHHPDGGGVDVLRFPE